MRIRNASRGVHVVQFLALLVPASCDGVHNERPDATPDVAVDVAADGTTDVAADGTPDVAADGIVDAVADVAADAAVDATVDAAVSAPTILFVTQVPHSGFTTVGSTFGNHRASLDAVPRGGSLMLRYADGALRDLTREAGYGMEGMQGDRAIAVREPCVHWDGRRALFSMTVGAPAMRYQLRTYRWQLYEVTGLGVGERASIARVEGQPAEYNNVSPAYGSDDRVIFASDRPPSGAAHHYPQLDEYESAPTTTGIYAIDAGRRALSLLEVSPSGVTSLRVDGAGRVVFTKWDHLQRDQQADAPATMATYGGFTWADEGADAARSTVLRGAEMFPEARTLNDPAYDARWALHSFNHFLPWQIAQDGTGEETLNHVGRQELGGSYTDGSFRGDANLTYFTPESTHRNRLKIVGSAGLLHLRESPVEAGLFYATYAPEFATDGSGAILRVRAAPTVNPEDMVLEAVTHPDCFRAPNSAAEVPASTGRYRNPLPLSDGTVAAVYSRAPTPNRNRGTGAAPDWLYDFRLVRLRADGAYQRNGEPLTAGLRASVQWWSPDALIAWSGTLWELDPVEVHARPRPPMGASTLEAPETAMFSEARVDVVRLRAWLRDNNLALLVGRNVTVRDRADVQQPYNLAVPGGARSVPRGGAVYEVSHLQFVQGDALRGYGGVTSPRAGRRLLARPMHAPTLPAQTPPGAPEGSVAVAADGSFAAFVPAGRAMSWQLTDPRGAPVVRERNWVSFVAGEIRLCPSCHGVNRASQTGTPEVTNAPAALRARLAAWAAAHP